jgi:hypothetical protein
MTDLLPLKTAARDLDDVALASWADALEENGHDEGAAALRALPDLLASIQTGIVALRRWGLPPHKIYTTLEPSGRWVCVPVNVTPSDHIHGQPLPGWDEHAGRSAAVRVLLARWDDMHAGVEWLARRLELPVVELGFNGMVPGMVPGERWRVRDWGPFSLRRGRLRPIPGATISECTLRHART